MASSFPISRERERKASLLFSLHPRPPSFIAEYGAEQKNTYTERAEKTTLLVMIQLRNIPSGEKRNQLSDWLQHQQISS